MSRAERTKLVPAMFALLALIMLLASCSPCVSAYVVGCAPFPDAALRQ